MDTTQTDAVVTLREDTMPASRLPGLTRIQMLEAILNADKDRIYVFDVLDRYLYVPPSGAGVFGLTPEQMIGKTPIEVGIPADFIAPLEAERQRVAATGEPISGTITYPQNEKGRDYEYTWSPLRNADGHIDMVLLISRDVTEQNRRERAMQEMEARFRVLAETVPNLIWTCDADGRTDFVSRQWTDYTGLTLEQLHQIGLAYINHTDDTPRIQASWDNAVETGEIFEDEYRYRRHDGEYRWLLGRALPIRDEYGKIIQWIGSMTDIHAQKMAKQAIEQAQQAARASEEQARRTIEESRNQLHLITHTAPVLIAYVDRSQCYRFVNRHYAIWFERPLENIDGAHMREVVGEQAYEGIRAYIETALSGQAVSFEKLMPYTNAKARYIHGDFVPDINERGEVCGFVSVVSDISEMKQAEEERERHLREIAALNDHLQRAMAETHHRVKNNLQTIGALVEIQANEQDNTLSADGTRRLTGHIQTLASVHELLTHQVRKNPQADVLSTNDILDRLLPVLQALAGSRRVAPTVEEFALTARQGTSLAMVVNELVSNAIKHGRGDVHISLTQQQGNGVLEVCDDGPGFPPDFIAGKASHVGTELIERLSRWDLKGKISYSNPAPGGAQVTVIFPLGEPRLTEPFDL